jgi:hypothetical protein
MPFSEAPNDFLNGQRLLTVVKGRAVSTDKGLTAAHQHAGHQ